MAIVQAKAPKRRKQASRAATLTVEDWQLIAEALESYAKKLEQDRIAKIEELRRVAAFIRRE